MAYTAWSVVFGEQPTAAKWNQLGANDAGFKDGTNIDNLAILTRHLNNDGVTGEKIGSYYIEKQTNTTNSTENTQLIQGGVGMITGDTTNAIEESVTFPVAFAGGTVPIVFANAFGFRPTADGFNLSGLSSWEGQTAVAGEATNTSFMARMRRNDGATYGNTTNYYYTWLAIGTKA